MLRKNAIIIFLLGFIFTYLFYLYIIPLQEKTIINLISLLGTYISIYGILLAYLQILSLRQLTLKTQEAVKTSSESIQRVLSVAELSKIKKLIEEIQQYLHNDNFNGSVIRMNDLKENLIQNKYVPQLARHTSTKHYREVISNTGVDINTLNDKVSKPQVIIDKSIIMRNLEKAKSTILEFENELKYKNDE